jgi:hypothetical protein
VEREGARTRPGVRCAGALISGIAFQLARGGFEAAGPWPLTVGLAAGALVFFFADRAVEQWAIRTGGMAGLSLALGGLLDGIPEGRSSASGCRTARACPWRS